MLPSAELSGFSLRPPPPLIPALLLIVVGGAVLALAMDLVQSLSRRWRLAKGLRRFTPVRLGLLGTIRGRWAGTGFGVRAGQDKRWQYTALFVETKSPPFEFFAVNESEGDLPSPADVLPLLGSPAGLVVAPLMAVAVAEAVEYDNIFSRAFPATDHLGLGYFTEDRRLLEKLLADATFDEHLTRLATRPGYVYLLARKLPWWRVGLVLDGFTMLAPFGGRTGLALLRRATSADSPTPDEIRDDLDTLAALAAHLGRIPPTC
jgi:hypothetical protein